MEWLLVNIILLLCVLVIILMLKIHLMRKAAAEIQEAFANRLRADTNTLITISSSDKYMRRLAADINVQLRELRELCQRFRSGDLEVKNAIANISHDIRTPLTAIFGYLELLSKEKVSENAARYIKVIGNRAEMLKSMSEELFDYSYEVSSDIELEQKPVDVGRVLQESIASFYTEFVKNNIIPNIEITEKKIVRQANPAALSRVFSNLLSNAIKYSEGDFEIVLTDSGEFRFINTVYSLSNVEVGRLFDRFYTVENARKSTGLGLAIVKVLIEKMSGEITAHYANDRLRISFYLSEIKG